MPHALFQHIRTLIKRCTRGVPTWKNMSRMDNLHANSSVVHYTCKHHISMEIGNLYVPSSLSGFVLVVYFLNNILANNRFIFTCVHYGASANTNRALVRAPNLVSI